MPGGVLWGAVWGSLVGGLVLLLAALLLDLGSGGAPVVTQTSEPPPAAPDAGPILQPGLAMLRPPDDPWGQLPLPSLAPRNLVPRLAQPALPRLAVGPDVPALLADLPPAPVARPAAPVAAPLASDFPLSPPERTGNVSSPVARAPASDSAGRARRGPSLSVAAPAVVMPARPLPPGPLIGAPGTPDIAPPPWPGDAVPPAPLPDVASARGIPPAPAPPVAAAPRPQMPGPRVAFVLDGATDEPHPRWIGAQATGEAAGRLNLAGGGAVVMDPGAASQGALLAYTRLDGRDASDATALARIALRARRDGAVTVVVAPDPALWDRIGAWLDGPARDLVPVGAADLLE